MTRRLPPKETENMTISKQKIKKASALPATKARVAKRTAKVAPLKAKTATKLAGANTPAPTAHGSKTAEILDLLKRPGGVTLKDLVKATGWQPNSVRGFLSGAIGKKLGTPVESFKSSDGDRSYRVSSK
jgi:hypothetical protein